MPNLALPDIPNGTTVATDSIVGIKSGTDDSLALLPYGADLDLKANLASPTFTGVVTVPSPASDVEASTKGYVDTEVAAALPLAGGTMTGPLNVEVPTVEGNALRQGSDATVAAVAATTGVFTGDVTVPSNAYSSGWSGSTAVPTRTDVYDQIQSLGTGVIPGGLTGQTLSKLSNTDYDVAWNTALGDGDMLGAANLSDVDDAATSRTNLGLGTAATTAAADYATAAQGATADLAAAKASNLSDLADAATARANLGLGTVATTATTDYATAAQGVTADTALQTVAVPGSITATGTANSTTFLRGDGAWAAAGLAGTDGDVIAYQPLLYRNDERSTELTYTGDDLTQVLEKDGATTVKQTDLTYTAGKLTSVVELADSITVTTALTYTGDNLTSTTRTVT